MARVAALVPDLLFASKLVAALEGAGHRVARCTREEEAWSAVDEADVLVVDLTSDDVDGITLVDSLRSGGELHAVRTLGFYAHVDTDTRARAREVGFDLVVPRSRLARDAAALVQSLAQPAQAP